jgi:hypothetical protein
MKIKNIILVLLVILIELSIMGPLLSTYFLSILTAAVLYISLEAKTEEALIAIFAIGFIVDICSFNKFLTTSFFLLAEFVVIYLSQRKFVDFRNPAAIFLFLTSFSLIRLALQLFIYQSFSSQITVIYSVLANILLSFALSLVISKLSLLNKTHAKE